MSPPVSPAAALEPCIGGADTVWCRDTNRKAHVSVDPSEREAWRALRRGRSLCGDVAKG